MYYWPLMTPMIPNLAKIYNNCDLPPTIYALLNSYVNFSNENPEKIKDLAKAGRACIFDFDYPLAEGWDKEDFECMILNHFLMRRIGYETVTAFKIALDVKLNEVMPMYNKLYDSIKNWNLFTDGETINKTTHNMNEYSSDSNSSNTSSDTSDQRFSNTPQNQLSDVRDGKYVSEYQYNQNTGSQNGTDSTDSTSEDNGTETITRTPHDKIKLYQEFLASRQNIYTMIFKDLDSLFYQIVS